MPNERKEEIVRERERERSFILDRSFAMVVRCNVDRLEVNAPKVEDLQDLLHLDHGDL